VGGHRKLLAFEVGLFSQANRKIFIGIRSNNVCVRPIDERLPNNDRAFSAHSPLTLKKAIMGDPSAFL
jgi:hypothetical protein